MCMSGAAGLHGADGTIDDVDPVSAWECAAGDPVDAGVAERVALGLATEFVRVEDRPGGEADARVARCWPDGAGDAGGE